MCIGEHDESFIHVEMTPPFGQTPIGDAEMSRVIDCINDIGKVRNLDPGETAIADASAHELSRLKDVVFLSLCPVCPIFPFRSTHPSSSLRMATGSAYGEGSGRRAQSGGAGG